MGLHQQTAHWVDRHLITASQRQAILESERQKIVPFFKFGLFWIGILCLLSGISFIVADYWAMIPSAVKIAGGGVLLGMMVTLTVYFFKKEKKTLTELGLFLSFLGIGAFIGLIAQVFALPLDSGRGLLIWAVLSFVIVMFSQRIYLSFLWIPLFLGGLLGYLKWEFLFLFFQQVPIFTTFLSALVLLMIVALTADLKAAFAVGLRHWAILLYFGATFLGDFSAPTPFLGMMLSVILLVAIGVTAVLKHKSFLFNLTSFLLVLRIIFFYFQSVPGLSAWGIGLIALGAILVFIGYLILHKRLP